jgi:hypothetical protein
MNVRRSGYEKLDWVDAIMERKNKLSVEERLATVKEEDIIDKALEQTVEAAFEIPTTEETSEEAVRRAGKSIQDVVRDRNSEDNKKYATERLEKTKSHESNGRHEQWKKDWQEQVFKTVVKNNGFNPESSKGGRITSASASEPEDARGPTMRTPLNANSIFDPFKLDRLAAEESDREKSIKESRESRDARSQKWSKEASEGNQESPISVNEGSKILRSGGLDQEVFIQRVPSDKVSMLDVKDDGASKDDRHASLKELFTHKVKDVKADSQKASKERKEGIQRETSDDRSWEKVEPPQKISDINRRLMELWMPDKKKE